MATGLKAVAHSQLRREKKRFILTGVGIALAAFFLTAVFILNATIGATNRAALGSEYHNANLVVNAPAQVLTSADSANGFYLSEQQLLDVQKAPSVEAIWPVNRSVSTSLEGSAGSATANLEVAPTDPGLFPYPFEGKFSSGKNEIMLARAVSDATGLKIGDTTEFYSFEQSANSSGFESESEEIRYTVTITGVFDAPQSSSFANAILENSDYALNKLSRSDHPSENQYISAILLKIKDFNGQVPQDITQALGAHGESNSQAVILSPQESADARTKVITSQSVGIIGILLVFAGIALFVSSFVISNTFTILTTQRVRELALLRTLGATKRSLTFMLLREALWVGLISSLLGVALAYALAALVGLLFPQTFVIGFSALSGLLGLALGLGVTLIAATRPALRAFKISPVSALSQSQSLELEKPTRPLPLFVGGLFLLVGSGAACMGWEKALLGYMLIATFSLALGFLLIFPALLHPLMLLAQKVFGSSSLGQISTAAVLRSPARTAATGRAIFISVTLIAAVLVGYVSVQKSTNAMLEQQYPVDIEMRLSTQPSEYSGILTLTRQEQEQALEATRTVEGIEAVALLRSVGSFEYTNSGLENSQPVYSAPFEQVQAAVASLTTVHLSDDEILVNSAMISTDYKEGDTILVNGPTGSKELKLLISDIPFYPSLVTESTGKLLNAKEQELNETASSSILVANADNSVTARQANQIMERFAEAASLGTSKFSTLRSQHAVQGAMEQRLTYDTTLKIFLSIVLGLLGISTLISLVGITNTLGLSAHQRRRENALMRALGLSRQGIKKSITAEALLIALGSSVIGILAGTTLAAITVHLIFNQGFPVTVDIPWLGFAILLLATVVLTWLASFAPAARAARVPPVAALQESN